MRNLENVHGGANETPLRLLAFHSRTLAFLSTISHLLFAFLCTETRASIFKGEKDTNAVGMWTYVVTFFALAEMLLFSFLSYTLAQL